MMIMMQAAVTSMERVVVVVATIILSEEASACERSWNCEGSHHRAACLRAAGCKFAARWIAAQRRCRFVPMPTKGAAAPVAAAAAETVFSVEVLCGSSLMASLTAKPTLQRPHLPAEAAYGWPLEINRSIAVVKDTKASTRRKMTAAGKRGMELLRKLTAMAMITTLPCSLARHCHLLGLPLWRT